MPLPWNHAFTKDKAVPLMLFDPDIDNGAICFGRNNNFLWRYGDTGPPISGAQQRNVKKSHRITSLAEKLKLKKRPQGVYGGKVDNGPGTLASLTDMEVPMIGSSLSTSLKVHRSESPASTRSVSPSSTAQEEGNYDNTSTDLNFELPSPVSDLDNDVFFDAFSSQQPDEDDSSETNTAGSVCLAGSSREELELDKVLACPVIPSVVASEIVLEFAK